MKSLSRIRLLATPWTAAHQAPPSMGLMGLGTNNSELEKLLPLPHLCPLSRDPVPPGGAAPINSRHYKHYVSTPPLSQPGKKKQVPVCVGESVPHRNLGIPKAPLTMGNHLLSSGFSCFLQKTWEMMIISPFWLRHFFFFKYLFVRLCQVLAAACGILVP